MALRSLHPKTGRRTQNILALTAGEDNRCRVTAGSRKEKNRVAKMVLAQIAELSMTLHLRSDWLMAAENVTTFIFCWDQQSHRLGHRDPDSHDSISRGKNCTVRRWGRLLRTAQNLEKSLRNRSLLINPLYNQPSLPLLFNFRLLLTLLGERSESQVSRSLGGGKSKGSFLLILIFDIMHLSEHIGPDSNIPSQRQIIFLPDSRFPAVGGSSINANYKQNRLRRPEGFCCYIFKWVRFLNLREQVEEPALNPLKSEFPD